MESIIAESEEFKNVVKTKNEEIVELIKKYNY